MDKQNNPSPLLGSPVQLFFTVALSVFIAETIIMLVLDLFPQPSRLVDASIDAALLVIFVSPTLYFLLIKPLALQIAQRERAEAALLKSGEEQFKTMIHTSLDGFWITDLRGRFLEVNSSYAQMIGYSREELLQMSVADIEVMESPEETAQHVRKLLEIGYDRFVTRHRHKDGHILDIEISANYHEFNDGRIFCFLHDITQRKQVQERLQLSDQVLDSLTDSVFLFDLQGNFAYLNEAAWKTRGYSYDELKQLNLRALNTPEYSHLLGQRINHLQETGHGTFEAAHLCKDGTVLPVEINSRITGYNDTKMILAVVRDISERKRMETALKESEEMFRSMSNNTKDAMIMMDDSGNVTFWNQAAEKVFGYSAGEVMGRELHDFIAPAEYRETFHEAFARFRQTGEGPMIGKTRELPALRKGGGEFPVELALAALKLKGRWHAVGLARDISERKQIEELLRENEARLKSLFENLSSGVAIYRTESDGHDFIITSFNHAAERIDNIRRADVIGKSVTATFPGILEFGLLDVFRRVHRSGKAEHFPVTFYQDGRIAGWRENYVYKLPNGEIVAIYDDVTKEKQAEERMHHMAHYDPLTDLPNRALFQDRLQLALAAAKREKHMAAMMFIDLDRFKPVNDNLGHDIGDMLLKEVALRLRNCVRESDTVARIGGDEFVILLPRIDSVMNAGDIAAKALHALNQTFEIGGNLISISCSIGVAVYPQHGQDGKQLSKNADTAMYHAKNKGRSMVKLYTSEMDYPG